MALVVGVSEQRAQVVLRSTLQFAPRNLGQGFSSTSTDRYVLHLCTSYDHLNGFDHPKGHRVYRGRFGRQVVGAYERLVQVALVVEVSEQRAQVG